MMTGKVNDPDPRGPSGVDESDPQPLDVWVVEMIGDRTDHYARDDHVWHPSYVHYNTWYLHMRVGPDRGTLRGVVKIKWRVESETDAFERMETIRTPDMQPFAQDTVPLSAPGPIKVQVFMTMDDGTTRYETRRITIEDFLVVSIGDSYASGQGNPDRPGMVDHIGRIECEGPKIQKTLEKLSFGVLTPGPSWMMREPKWLEPKGWRSLQSSPARAADLVRSHRDGRMVRFVSFATSGATIQQGLIGTQHNWQKVGQVEEVAQLLRSKSRIRDHRSSSRPVRPCDVLLLSIGGNDVGFETGVTGLTVDRLSILGIAVHGETRSELRRGFTQRLQELPADFDALASAIEGRIAPRCVMITEYPTALFDDSRGHAAAADGVFQFVNGWGITKDDAELIEEIGGELNAVIRAEAKQHGWVVVQGIDKAFRRHGYSSGQSYYVSAELSCKNQGDLLGTLHPNQAGTGIAARLIATDLERQLDKMVPDWPRPRPSGPATRFDPEDEDRPSERVSVKKADPDAVTVKPHGARFIWDDGGFWRPIRQGEIVPPDAQTR